MPLICIQCAMQAFVDGREYLGEVREETNEEHMARVHPGGVDPEARRQLELRYQEKMLQGLRDGTYKR